MAVDGVPGGAPPVRAYCVLRCCAEPLSLSFGTGSLPPGRAPRVRICALPKRRLICSSNHASQQLIHAIHPRQYDKQFWQHLFLTINFFHQITGILVFKSC